jgi:hypothetical protein
MANLSLNGFAVVPRSLKLGVAQVTVVGPCESLLRPVSPDKRKLAA